MPAKNIDDRYCRHLNELFIVTKPVKVELGNIIRNRNNKIREVEKTLSDLVREYYNGYSLYPGREIISITKTFLKLCNMLRDNNYDNADAIYQTMDSLNLMSYVLCNVRETIKIKALNEAEELYYKVDEDILIEKFDEMFLKFEKIIKPTIFEFWDYAVRISVDFPANNDSMQHIFLP